MTKALVLGSLAALLLAALAYGAWTPDRDRASLEARYLQAPTDMVKVARWRLHVRDTGPRQARAILMIHGFAASLHTWEPWALELARTHRVVRIDLPGSGLSDPDPDGDYRDARTMELLLALMDQLGIAQAHVIGHSIGGRMAWTFAGHHPKRVDRLVLLSPDGFGDPHTPYSSQPEVPAVMGMMRYVLPKPVLRWNLEPAYANPAVLTDALLTRYHELLLAPGSRTALHARMQQTVLTDPVPWLQRIQAPTLLLWGDRDALIPVSTAARFKRALPHCTLVTLPGVGHVPQEEGPPAVLDQIREFLR